MSFLWAFEPAILEIHPKRRQASTWCSLLRTKSPLALKYAMKKRKADGKQTEDRQIPAELAIQEIQGTASMNELIDCLHENSIFACHYPAYRFSQLAENDIGQPCQPFKRTIEFRQHAATLDFTRIEAWVETVVSIVELCRETSGTHWLSLLISKQTNPYTSVDIVQLLRLMGAEKASQFYAENPGSFFSQSNRRAGHEETLSESPSDSSEEDSSAEDEESDEDLI